MLCALPLLAFGAAAQDYPRKPVKIIVAYSAGGPMDVGARALAAGLTKALGQPFVVENKTGASGRIGTEAVLRAEPDGYTLMYAIADQLAINPHIYPNASYDPLTAFEPVAPLGRMPMVVALRSGLNTSTGQSLVKLAKASPGKLTYASWGPGSLGHLGGAMMEQSAGIEMLHVPYQGGAPAQAALMAGQVDMLLVQVPFAEQQVKAGKMKILGLTSPKRNPQYPDIPTLAEQGFPGYAAETWSGVLLPKGTPASVKATLAHAINDFVTSPTGQAQLKEIGFEVMTESPAEFAAFIRAENDRWGKLIRARRIVVQ
ncbi:tripartite tricarboxylate transporter substrate binding protein [Polaromonas sp. P1-6]|nr:tripartite tricarboxylate transporter substrate binding protein [Polaromonas sp. P1-6]